MRFHWPSHSLIWINNEALGGGGVLTFVLARSRLTKPSRRAFYWALAFLISLCLWTTIVASIVWIL